MRSKTANTMRLAVVLALSFLKSGLCDLLRDSVHVTSAAARPNNELWCYKCHAGNVDDKCAHLGHNNSTLIHKCHNERRMCMVKRFAYTTSNENSTTALKMWALERNCTKHCEPGCIVIGERTKLYACTSCCTTSLCNHGSGAPPMQTFDLMLSIFMSLLYLCVNLDRILYIFSRSLCSIFLLVGLTTYKDRLNILFRINSIYQRLIF